MCCYFILLLFINIMKSCSDIKNIYYINLDSRQDRRLHFENQMKMLKWNAIRFPAIKNKVGAIGCSLSHLSLLNFAKKNDLDHILIMEDDITFLNPYLFIENLNKLLEKYNNFDVLLIAGNNMGEYEKLDNNCVKISKCQTTTGYLVKKHYYDKLIKNIHEGITLLCRDLNKLDFFAIDQYWESLQKIDKWYLLTPLTVIQKQDYSDIEGKIINYTSAMLDLDKKEYLTKKKELQERIKMKQMKFT